jgi:hypothetical protein
MDNRRRNGGSPISPYAHKWETTSPPRGGDSGGYGSEREKEGAGEREGRLFRAKLKHKLEAGAERLKSMLGQPQGAGCTRNAVTLRDFRAAMARVGFVLDDRDAREMLSRATVDGEGRIDVEQLVHDAEADPHPFIIGFNKGEVRDTSPARCVCLCPSRYSRHAIFKDGSRPSIQNPPGLNPKQILSLSARAVNSAARRC